MAGHINKVQIMGNVGNAPEIRTFQNGGRVGSFSIATTDRWKDKATGENRERTEWHRISVLDEKLLKVIEAHVGKGDTILIEGKLETRKWTDRDGKEKYSTEVVMRPFNSSLKLIARKKAAPSAGDGIDELPEPELPQPTAQETYTDLAF